MTTALDEVKAKVAECTACNLCLHRTKIVFGEGKEESPEVMIIGEAPGEEEDLAGSPFVGACGKKLNEMLKYADLERNQVYITNSVLCRPPNNRNPTMKEVESCRSRLLAQIAEIKPRMIVVLGKVAAQALIGKEIKGPLSKLFDKFHDMNLDGMIYNILFSYHPSYLLRNRKVAYPIMLKHWTTIKDTIRIIRSRQTRESLSN